MTRRKVALVVLTFLAAPAMWSVGHAAVLATQDQALVGAALEKLKLKAIAPKGGIIGGPQQFEVTEETLKFLKGKVVTVDPDGSIKVAPKKTE